MQPINLNAYERLAQAQSDPLTWDYYGGGSEDEVTLRANCSAFQQIRLRPRVLVDVSACDLRTTVLGTPVSMPILIAPMGCQALAHPEGERATARAAGAARTLMVASTMSNVSLIETAQVATGPLWFQLYVYRDRRVSERLVRQAEQAGYRALVITVDTPRMGRRERDISNGFGLPAHLRFANIEDAESTDITPQQPGRSALAAHTQAAFDPALSWGSIAWLRSITALPILIKGILTAEDAALAVAHGVDGIIVSNHGGRQLDGALATIEALPEVVAAVAGACEVYLDGGIRRGTDALKALALGARAVLVGRPVLWGLTVGGAAGVEHVLALLATELETAMALAGRPTIATIDRSLVKLAASWQGVS